PKDLAADANEDEALAHAAALEKYKKSQAGYEKKQRLFEAEAAEKAGQRRASLRTALKALNGRDATTLEFFVLTADEAAPARGPWHRRNLLGPTTGGSEEDPVWPDENDTLRVVLRVAHPGSLAERMEWVEAPAEDGDGLGEEVRRAANRRARQTYYKRV